MDRRRARGSFTREEGLVELVERCREVVRVEQHHPAAQTSLVDLDGDEEPDLVAPGALEVRSVQREALAARGDRRRRDPAEAHLGHGPKRDDVGLGTDGLRVGRPVTTIDPHEVGGEDLGHPVVVLASEELVETRHHGGGGVLGQGARLTCDGFEHGGLARRLARCRGLGGEARGALGRVQTGGFGPSRRRPLGVAGSGAHAGEGRAGVGVVEHEIGARGDSHGLLGEHHRGGVAAGGEHLRPRGAPGDGGLEVLACKGFAGLGHLVGFVDATLGQQRAGQ